MKLEISDTEVDFDPAQLIIAGFTGRDQASVQRHVEELEEEGVPPPENVPVFFFLDPSLLTTEETIQVYGARTSGEVEPVLVQYQGEFHVGVGSDHTDRHLETVSMAKSKAICPKVISTKTWPYSSVRKEWDRLILRSWVGASNTPYQEGTLEELLTPDDILDVLYERYELNRNQDGVFFLGTIPLLTETIQYNSRFRGQLVHPENDDARLTFTYRVQNLEQSPRNSGGSDRET